MSELGPQIGNPAEDHEAAVSSQSRIVLDARHPRLLDHREHVLEVVAGHVDIFAVNPLDGNSQGARHHLFRIEHGEVILDLQEAGDSAGRRPQIIAVGGPGAEVLALPRRDLPSFDPVARWITRLAALMADQNPSWEMRELTPGAAVTITPGERCRGPVRNIVWVAIEAGSARLIGLDPAYDAGGPPMPLTSGMWIEAGPSCVHRRHEQRSAGRGRAVACGRSLPSGCHGIDCGPSVA